MPTNPPRAAKPSKEIFDPFNSSATGHQRAENRLSGSTSWRDSRHLKLREQFNSGRGGGKRVHDTVGAGSLEFSKTKRKDGNVPAWSKLNDQMSVQGGMKIVKEIDRPTKRIKLDDPSSIPVKDERSFSEKSIPPDSSPSNLLSPIDPNSSFNGPTLQTRDETNGENEYEEPGEPNQKPCPQIFNNLTFYINGSTAPSISDHKLKHLLTKHGGRMSITLGRRTVTHVILGRPNSNGGSGGGLCASKIQKEISSKRGESVKYVTVEWVLESVKAGKRLQEFKFEAVRLAPKGVRSAASMFGTFQQAVDKRAIEGG